ncbi:MAG: cation diffusion facilitator family transporter [Apilactobacillus sp.]|uniref:cation diffusion facilitator family transporter n=1 Tax=Apilactobacillus sp. TaxID=2767901 RepID=UPI0025D887D4|nr:cation diffusion facilitator family transporter [Apilactobacillus sp.]MCT6823268.1 cation diffusion facilitator family transporter [Apilactobacillus sp.]MCT6858786.1 cation diffusion facilitator family transporter [Apilactobacillus sp.]
MHEHNHNEAMSQQRFFTVTILNTLITLVEFVGGILSGSLSLLSDAFHNFADSASVVGSYYAHRISQRPQNQLNTFGYKRAQIISAFLNSLFLVIISVVLIVEGVQKLFKPEQINGNLMLIVAVVSTVANLISTVMLSRGSKHNLNIRATYLHLLSDTLASLGVIFGGILIKLFNWVLVDPIVTIIVAIYISAEAYPIIKKTVKILMQGSPMIDCYDIQNDMMQIDGITGVHHVHIWSVDENSVIFSAHVNMDDMLISEAEKIYDPVSKLLHDKYGIEHVTLQAEVKRGTKEDLYFDTKTDIE